MPLNMRYTSFRQPLPVGIAADAAVGYPKLGQPSPGFDFIGPGPAGEGSSSGAEMARLILANLGSGPQILSPATLAMMHDSPLAKVNRRSLIPSLSWMELDFFETNLNGHEIIGHLGDTEAFQTSLHLFLKQGGGLYVSFNSPSKAGAIGALRAPLFHDFADRYSPDIAPPDGRVDLGTAAGHAAAMTGTWWASRRAETSFLLTLCLLTKATVATGPHSELIVPSITGASGRPNQWIEIAPFVWPDRDGQDRLAAQIENGKPIRWSYNFASPFEV